MARPQYDYLPPQPQQQPSYQGGNSFSSPQRPAPRPQQPARVEVSKDIYVHIAPPEPQEEFQAPAQPPQVARKHYKIIFIKAPSSQPQHQQLAAVPPPQHEEKTIVYVLVKKPEQLQLDSPPAEPPRPPTKPEVYFIKYRGQEAPAPSGGSGFSAGGPPAQEYGPPQLPQIAPAPAPQQQQGYQKK